MSESEPRQAAFLTDHVHWSMDGDLLLCKSVMPYVNAVKARGFSSAEVFFRVMPDGSVSNEDALHVWFKGDGNGYNWG